MECGIVIALFSTLFFIDEKIKITTTLRGSSTDPTVELPFELCGSVPQLLARGMIWVRIPAEATFFSL